MLHATLVAFTIVASLHCSLGLSRRCLEPISDGSEYGTQCYGHFESWGYDAKKATCVPFVYSGCFGNRNRFNSREQCLVECITSRSPRPQSWLRVSPDNDLSRTLKIYEPLNLGEIGLLLFNFGPGRKVRPSSSYKFDNLFDNSEKLYGNSEPLFRPLWRAGTNSNSNENDSDESDTSRSNNGPKNPPPTVVQRLFRPPWRKHSPLNLEVGAKWSCKQTKVRMFRPPWRTNSNAEEDQWICEPLQVLERLFRPPWRKSADPGDDDDSDEDEDMGFGTARLFKESGFTKKKDEDHVPFRERLLSQLFKSSGRVSEAYEDRGNSDQMPLFRPPWRSDSAESEEPRIVVQAQRAFKSPEMYLSMKDDRPFTLKLISRVLEAIVQ